MDKTALTNGINQLGLHVLVSSNSRRSYRLLPYLGSAWRVVANDGRVALSSWSPLQGSFRLSETQHRRAFTNVAAPGRPQRLFGCEALVHRSPAKGRPLAVEAKSRYDLC